jgi:hypothetical protein
MTIAANNANRMLKADAADREIRRAVFCTSNGA